MKLSEEIYYPEKLFFSNLFYCLSISTNDFLDNINDKIFNDINDEIAIIEKNIELNHRTVFPPSKIIAIDNMYNECLSLMNSEKGSRNKRKKVPDYCLFKKYEFIHNVREQFENKTDNLNVNEDKDRESILKFKGLINKYEYDIKAGTISKKNLENILDPLCNSYNKDKKKLIKYILKNVIPLIINYENKYFMLYVLRKFEQISVSASKD